MRTRAFGPAGAAWMCAPVSTVPAGNPVMFTTNSEELTAVTLFDESFVTLIVSVILPVALWSALSDRRHFVRRRHVCRESEREKHGRVHRIVVVARRREQDDGGEQKRETFHDVLSL